MSFNFKTSCLIAVFCFPMSLGIIYAGTSEGADFAKGRITKVIVSNENNMTPGFSICVNDSKAKEVCMWRKLNTYNYQQLLDVANMAMIANKQVSIIANIVGGLDTIIVHND